MATRADLSELDPSIVRFAERLRDHIGAVRILLFGSFARGTAHRESDYDLIIVADHFGDIPRLKRQIGLRDMFYQVGGQAPMDLICVTPAEFAAALERSSFISAVLPEAIDLIEPETAPA
jgi:predicted nucleotidyltransferase